MIVAQDAAVILCAQCMEASVAKDSMECWECGKERPCRPRMRPDHSVEYLCKECAATQAEVDKLRDAR